MVKQGDEVLTKVYKAGIPADTFGGVRFIEENSIWVDVYTPVDADSPEDTVRYSEEELTIR